jgi:hypothetical protein
MALVFRARAGGQHDSDIAAHLLHAVTLLAETAVIQDGGGVEPCELKKRALPFIQMAFQSHIQMYLL